MIGEVLILGYKENKKMLEFKTRNGEKLVGRIIKQYRCFEGHIRYIFETITGIQYRCIETNEGYVEEVI